MLMVLPTKYGEPDMVDRAEGLLVESTTDSVRITG